MIEVRAFDKDEEASITTYSIQAGNQGGAFRVEERTGYIRVAKPLDYEAIRRYQLTLRAGDGIFWNEVRGGKTVDFTFYNFTALFMAFSLIWFVDYIFLQGR